MELKILEEKNNVLFNRKEIKFSVDSDISPSRENTLKLIAEKFKVPEGNIKIKGINGRFGSNTFTVEANIYSSKEDKDRIEIKKKKELEAEKKLEEASTVTEQPKETKEVTEEKKEEKVVESTESKEQTEAPKEETNTANTENPVDVSDSDKSRQEENKIPEDSGANK